MVDSSVNYIIEKFDYEHATPQDTAEIGAVYDHCFTNDLNLIFDPSLDADFVDPCKYYSKASGGAFFVVRRVAAAVADDSTDGEKKEEVRNPIVGTLGVRNFVFESEERWAAFVEGIKANTNPCDTERTFASSCTVKKSDGEGCDDNVTISYPVNNPSQTASSSFSSLKVCELKRMFFLPECRGRQLGKQQVSVALDWAAASSSSSSSAGYHYCILDTKRRLEAANHVYEKYGGFVECGSYNGNPRADKFMCKLLLSPPGAQ